MPTVREGVRLASAGMGRRYFSSETFDFLQDLELFNERSWFQANKERYEIHVREPLLQFIEDLREPLHAAVSSHLVCDSRKVGGSMFRINRDTRFAKDKSPYKTQVAARFSHEAGRDAHAPGLYLHLEPGNCYVGGGLWMPPSAALLALRQAMVDRPGEWTEARDADSLRRWGFIGVAADGAAGLQRRRPTHRGSASYVVCRQPPAHREAGLRPPVPRPLRGAVDRGGAAARLAVRRARPGVGRGARETSTSGRDSRFRHPSERPFVTDVTSANVAIRLQASPT